MLGEGFARYEWHNVAGTRTLILKVGSASDNLLIPSVSAPDKASSECAEDMDEHVGPRRMILIVPGNPGSIQFYEEFAVRLWELLGASKADAVWGVSHAGHVFHSSLTEEIFDGNDYPNLRFQITHKSHFVRECIPESVEEIVLIGHSIGVYISLKVLDELSRSSWSDRKLRVIGLFPTIERMAITPHGRLYTPVLRYFRWFLLLTVYGLSWLPEGLQRLVFRWYGPDMADHHFCAIRGLTNYHSFRNSILMARDEMEQVLELDGDLIERYVDRVVMYYGNCDHWCPVDYHTNIKQMFPAGQFHLCDQGYEHAFVLKHSLPMAQLVAKWLT
ncbi:lipid droplet-associated hydrolase-like isoform X2 [Paramacrobiotus metropolitanus]|uniref:lipid droplet-associated hydrolase-like isoform X2 n=1 Tax=Paramacrobiotus metropolitanus TaxID=2943436 RepID=UPI00244648E5|nr:lipid droplet-associated hydrolase-like isoform X2 [Paramacrobiotus metropolitanus]